MKTQHIRVRFAPSPTGFMHLGNVRAALINYIFAKQKNGKFILRIEDTDEQRNVDPHGKKIMEDLNWLGLDYDEGPNKGGAYEPYYQSERSKIYQDHLEKLKEKKLIYRCFCTVEELEKKRQRQIDLKTPPRYDRTCLKLEDHEINKKIEEKIPFIWRFKLDHSQKAVFYDLARKTLTFELKNFSDFPLTRQDNSFTFIFANFVDDYAMKISHVFRGEDHLTNTANQVALYMAFNVQIPVFYHLPIIFNQDNKKLSKRDFGFSLTDLKNGGFLPEAICNYLAIIGGGTFKEEIMDMKTLFESFNFDTISSTGQIKYDLEKLRWINHQWIIRYNAVALTALCKDFLFSVFPDAKNLPQEKLLLLITSVQKELITLTDVVDKLQFYFSEPIISNELLESYHFEKYKNILNEIISAISNKLSEPEEAVQILQNYCREKKLSVKEIFTLLRIALTGKAQGSSIKDLFIMLEPEKSIKRLNSLITL